MTQPQVQESESALPRCDACGVRLQHGPIYTVIVHELGDDQRLAEGIYHEDCAPATEEHE